MVKILLKITLEICWLLEEIVDRIKPFNNFYPGFKIEEKLRRYNEDTDYDDNHTSCM